MLCIVHETSPFQQPTNMDTNIRDPDNKAPSSTTTPVVQVHDNDVLGGRGNGVAAHPGNRLFRQVCIRHHQAYISAKRNEKMKIAKTALAEITSQTPPGRFLEKNSQNNWVIMNPKRVLEKVSQALRDRKSCSGDGGASGADSVSSVSSAASSTASPPCNVYVESSNDPMTVLVPEQMDYAYASAVQQQQQARELEQQQFLSSYLSGSSGVPSSAFASSFYQDVDSSALPHSLPPSYASWSEQQYDAAATMPDNRNEVNLALIARMAQQPRVDPTTTRDVLMMDPEEQFADAVEDVSFNTSLEIFHLARRKGYLAAPQCS